MSDPIRERAAIRLVLLATVAVAFKGIFAKLAYLEGGNPATVLVLRMLMATPIFWLMAASRSAPREPIRHKDIARALTAGMLFFVSALADFSAIDYLGVGPSRLVLFTYPMVLFVLEAIRDRRWPPRRLIASFAVAWAGLALLLDTSAPSSSLAEGLPLSIMAAVGYSLYLHIGEPVLARVGTRRYNAWSQTGALLPILVVVPMLDVDFGPPPAVVTWTAVMVVVSTVLPFLLLFEGIRRTGAGFASLITLVGPVVTVAAAWVLFDEILDPQQLWGMVLVLGAIALVRRWGPRSRSSPGPELESSKASR